MPWVYNWIREAIRSPSPKSSITYEYAGYHSEGGPGEYEMVLVLSHKKIGRHSMAPGARELLTTTSLLNTSSPILTVRV
ncbi:hypothetical protein ONS95_002744 [Cadophora gregata]|uniref:uncharacterized protein n=1 Tax=Cadophora gregata TaxID=51156 RepID=UPI0026DBCA98|nr:uncharacterized protein ONS95_002744 [Cadophora gregata]KAK0110088.1 hypothetical protein ONS95_002744 [Cadophora gregata]